MKSAGLNSPHSLSERSGDPAPRGCVQIESIILCVSKPFSMHYIIILKKFCKLIPSIFNAGIGLFVLIKNRDYCIILESCPAFALTSLRLRIKLRRDKMARQAAFSDQERFYTERHKLLRTPSFRRKPESSAAAGRQCGPFERKAGFLIVAKYKEKTGCRIKSGMTSWPT